MGYKMAAIADITVYDGAGTPVSHTLKAISVSRPDPASTLAEWQEKLTSVPDEAQVRVSARVTSLKSGITKVETRVVVPVMESISGQNASGYTAAPKVAYESTFVITEFSHKRATVSDRRLIRQMAINLLSDVSTSVAPDTSGLMPDLYDQLISPT
jgi:hypothetical protein